MHLKNFISFDLASQPTHNFFKTVLSVCCYSNDTEEIVSGITGGETI